jgi:formylglycine-generating enzyme required for sulfatase activity
MKVAALLVLTVIVAGCMASADAQEVAIPDAGLNAAIRDALQKPNGPLTDQDLLNLTILDASRRGVLSIQGLEFARNLVSLNLEINQITDFSLPPALTNLAVLNVSLNSLTNSLLPGGLSKLASVTFEGNLLAGFSVAAGLTGLTNLVLQNNSLTSLELPGDSTSLTSLNLRFNSFTNLVFPDGMTNLAELDLGGNLLTNYTIAPGLTGLVKLNLEENHLTGFTVPDGMRKLRTLEIAFNEITNLALPDDLTNLLELDLSFNRLSTLNFPSNLTHLSELRLRSNQLTDFSLPPDLAALELLDLADNLLTNFNLPEGLGQLRSLRLSGNTNLTSLVLPSGMTNLSGLFLRSNDLTNLVLPSDLSRLTSIDALGNRLAVFTLPAGLTALTNLALAGNQLTSLTLPPDLVALTGLVLDGNPLTTLVLSEPQAARLADAVAALRSQGVGIYVYPLDTQLLRPRPISGAFQFGLTGPPGVYAISASSDLQTWSQVGVASNDLGAVAFVDATAHSYPQRFYQAQPLLPLTNMVFIPPGTFTMGSPTNEQDRNTSEGPQTEVTLSGGFWIGKFEVTQREYLSVMNTNPSAFPEDLDRPVSSVRWLDATNYCWRLTQRELAAGRIPVGSQYRLPTEAEWERAARANTTTRFSYGDDPSYTDLADYAWYAANADLTVHRVGLKLPNPWGLYDMEGNVWEWCLDWFGDMPGGTVTDPTGAPSNSLGLKVMRGGAYDYFMSDCRSASRLFFPATEFHTDTDLGFRVVLVIERR